MDPDLAIIALVFISVTGIIARTVIKIQNMRLTARPSDELTARVEDLESHVHGLQQELAEAQERLILRNGCWRRGRGRRRWKDYLFRFKEASENTCLAQATADCG